MAPRGSILPNAATESAREARKSFFCDLCQKGYSRMNDFEAHEGSYDHQHRKRLKDMKQLTRDPNAAAKREKEKESSALKSINLSLASGAKKKAPAVFKSTFRQQAAPAPVQSAVVPNEDVEMGGIGTGGDGEDLYDPRFVTGCESTCPACHGAVKCIEPATLRGIR